MRGYGQGGREDAMLLGDRERQKTRRREQVTRNVEDFEEKCAIVRIAGVLVRAKVICAFVVILAAIVVGVYLGEWPWVWDSSDFLGWLVDLL